ncbi:patatin-like phospholipase family protein [Luteimonas sp. RD2P54]|uniref:Patatin-like phospholipase family protein n=1 Tax=Luteimonas endophytica TaxID=3042023 RepID=A0ABT6J5E9_9GAMM|nr:patatin-like phospholipase family protein [Luteimonas endophytica]MDH5821752.1 patatin-like phospholipase family protein [Luteimonas endophytica]
MALDAQIAPGREKVALALGAGGARGLAQIGVIEVLEERGFEIVTISGASSGALVGGIHAAGRLREFDARLQAMSRRDFLRLLDPVLGRSGMLRGRRLVDAMREVVGDPLIEELPIRFTAVAVDLQRQREVWLQSGRLWDALRASFAIPGLFLSHQVHGRELVDGGLLAPLPIAATRLSDAHRLVAVDMHGWPRRPPGQPAANGTTTPGRTGPGDAAEPGPDATGEAGAFADAGEADPPAPAGWGWRRRGEVRDMGLVEVMSRSLDTMQAQIARVQLALDPPELVIRIPRDACQFYEFWRARELIAIGRHEAIRALDAAGY